MHDECDPCERTKAALKEMGRMTCEQERGKAVRHNHSRNSRQQEDSCSDTDSSVLQPPSKEHSVYMTTGIRMCLVNRKVDGGKKKKSDQGESQKRQTGGDRVHHTSICLIDEVNSPKFIENHLENRELIGLLRLFLS